MNQQSELIVAYLLLYPPLVLLPLVGYALRLRGKAAGSTAFAVTLLAMALWQLAAALEILAAEPTAKLFWHELLFVALVSIPVGWLTMTLQYISDGGWATLRRVAVLSVIPILTLTLLLTNDLHGLMFRSVVVDSASPAPLTLEGFGSWFWVHVAYSYGLLLMSGTLLVGAMLRVPTLYRGQPLALLGGMLIPLAWNVAFVLGAVQTKGIDTTPVVGSLGAAICGWALFNYRLFDRAPVAYDKVVEAISDGVLAVDSRGCIVDINPAAEEILAVRSSQVIGRQMSEVFGHLPELLQLHKKPELPYVVLVQGEGEAQTHCAVRADPIVGWQGRSFGQVFVLRDFTLRKRAEDALRERDQRYQELADSLPETVFEADVAGRISFINKAGLEQFGHVGDEVERGLNLIQMLAEGDRERAARDIQRPTSAHGYLAQRKDRTTFPCMLSTNLVVRGGLPVGLRGIVVDISAQEDAQRERERLLHEVQRWAAHLDATIRAIPVGLVILDEKGNITEMNAFGQEIMSPDSSPKIPLTERLRELMLETTDGEPISLHAAPPMRSLRGERVRDEVVVLHLREGRTVCASVSAAPIRDYVGTIVGAVVTFTDITELLQLQRGRDDMVDAISHDLRGPLTVILGQGQILYQQSRKARTEEQMAISKAIVFSARQMNAMIDDLVDSIRVESGQMQVISTRVDVAGMTYEMLERLTGIMDTERVRIDIGDNLPPVSADPDRLARVLMNLLTNALKYSQPETDVVVTISQREAEVVTSISDRGDGISPDELPKLFNKYGRTRSSRGQRDSLGLGLYITKGLVEAQGGRVWVESGVGVGSTFSFSLPIASSGPTT